MSEDEARSPGPWAPLSLLESRPSVAATIGPGTIPEDVPDRASALAGSFATLAIVPLRSFGQFALVMVIGVLIDAFIVRSLLIPAGLSLMGTGAGWPGRRPLGRDAEGQEPRAQESPA